MQESSEHQLPQVLPAVDVRRLTAAVAAFVAALACAPTVEAQSPPPIIEGTVANPVGPATTGSVTVFANESLLRSGAARGRMRSLGHATIAPDGTYSVRGTADDAANRLAAANNGLVNLVVLIKTLRAKLCGRRCGH